MQDPVCGMNVSEAEAQHHINQNGQRYYFCSAHCEESFSAQPERYMKRRRKGFFARFLERLAKENKQTFGNNKPSCH